MSKLGDYIKQQKEKDIQKFFGEIKHTSNKYFTFNRIINDDEIIIVTSNIKIIKGTPVLVVGNNKAVYLKDWLIREVRNYNLDSKDEDKEKLKIFDQYIKDKDNLVPMRVDDTIMFLTLDVGDVPTIKSVRLALGLSEEAAAEYLMIPVCTFKDWEKGIGIDDSSTKVAIRTLAKYNRYKK